MNQSELWAFPGIKRSHPELRDGRLNGEYFPRHLQVAYGRAVARLTYRPGAEARGLYYLRDLPLSVWDLSAIGYRWAAIAFEDERMRIKGVVRVKGGAPFVGRGFPVKGGAR